MSVRRGAIAISAAVACAASISACGSSKSSTTPAAGGTLNTTQTKLAIEDSILKQRHIHATVTCPPEVVKEAGRVFTCVATSAKGKTNFTVTEKNNRGYVTYVGK